VKAEMRSAAKLNLGAGLRQAPVWIAMALIAGASWLYLGRMDASMSAMHAGGAAAHAGMAMGGGGAEALVAAFVMWAAMMVAMMLPTVAPSAAVFAQLAARRDAERANRASAIYVTGYIGCWIAFATLAALMQWGLTHALLLDPMARSTSTLLSAGLLLAAGIYQWLPQKRACLAKCRSPLAFFMARWRDGTRGALALGIEHGAYCVACCWALMAVMFVVGAMNLAWMGLFTLVVLGEKIAPANWQLDRILGAILVGSALWWVAGAWITG
jgi:predicted metal-binding membrane protein